MGQVEHVHQAEDERQARGRQEEERPHGQSCDGQGHIGDEIDPQEGDEPDPY